MKSFTPKNFDWTNVPQIVRDMYEEGLRKHISTLEIYDRLDSQAKVVAALTGDDPVGQARSWKMFEDATEDEIKRHQP